MLDTNICIYIMRQQPEVVFERFQRARPEQMSISSVSVAELSYGMAKSRRVEENFRALEQFLYPLTVLAFDKHAAYVYGRLRVTLERSGTPIGSNDTLIAAHALSLEATLVTNDTREFERVPELRLENWAEA